MGEPHPCGCMEVLVEFRPVLDAVTLETIASGIDWDHAYIRSCNIVSPSRFEETTVITSRAECLPSLMIVIEPCDADQDLLVLQCDGVESVTIRFNHECEPTVVECARDKIVIDLSEFGGRIVARQLSALRVNRRDWGSKDIAGMEG